jgi:hypothetical protein
MWRLSSFVFIAVTACAPQPERGLQLRVSDLCNPITYNRTPATLFNEVSSGGMYTGGVYKLGVLVNVAAPRTDLSVRLGEIPLDVLDRPSALGFTPDRLQLTYKVPGESLALPPRDVSLGGKQNPTSAWTEATVLDTSAADFAALPVDTTVEVSMVAWATNDGFSFFSNTVVFPIRIFERTGFGNQLPCAESECTGGALEQSFFTKSCPPP